MAKTSTKLKVSPSAEQTNPVQTHWERKLSRLGFYTSDLSEQQIPEEAKQASDEHTWGLLIRGDDDTDNDDRHYTQIEAHLVAARLLDIGNDPEAWTATVMRLDCECNGYVIKFVWSLDDSDEAEDERDDDEDEDDEDEDDEVDAHYEGEAEDEVKISAFLDGPHILENPFGGTEKDVKS